MNYVDGFVLVIAAKKLPTYKRVARLARKVWLEHGALEYVEAVGDDLDVSKYRMLPFPKLAKAKRGEVVVFSWIRYRSKAHRDRVNRNVMADPRIERSMKDCAGLMDMKRMAYGGFKAIVEGRQ